MPKKAKELSALEVRQLTKPGNHAVGGVAGLCLLVSATGARSWILRVTVGDKRREMGLGAFPDVPLADARAQAREAKAKVAAGVDPVEERQKIRVEMRMRQAALTFEQAAQAFFDTKKRLELSSDKHAKLWINSLRNHVIPQIGGKPIAEIDDQGILEILRPLIVGKPETGRKLRQRLEQIFDWAIAGKHYVGENPARLAGTLKAQLPSSAKLAKRTSHAAVQIRDLSRWFDSLNMVEGIGANGLRLLALAALRSQEVRLARWSDIDFEDRIWTIPARNMKTRKEHRVPLTDLLISLLCGLPRFKDNDFIVPAPRGGAMSDQTLSKCMKRLHQLDIEAGNAGFIDRQSGRVAVPHGLRSSFRDWAAERTSYSREIVEIALSHEMGSDVERAYRRSDMIEKRRQLMADWGNFLLGKETSR